MGTDHYLPTVLVAVRNSLDRGGSASGKLREAFGVLSAWDRRSSNDSVAMTLFVLTLDAAGQNGMSDEAKIADAFAGVVSGLEKDFGTWRVGWGEISRLQRYDESTDGSFRDDRPSVAVPGVSGREGGVFTFHAIPVRGQKRRYGAAGASYVNVVEFGPQVRGLSIHVFGSSGDPKNKHFMDQAPMYARGEFKPAWLRLEDIKANLESSYHPGEEKR
jgi:acyl-homoserine-lactone acylase